mmetsp:Transcript_7565/g.26636  ORF Transcript_7565/g.26636 Transcript_7565/m.26636 type:complete len:418 (-) Transcript_7565:568-1821(-)
MRSLGSSLRTSNLTPISPPRSARRSATSSGTSKHAPPLLVSWIHPTSSLLPRTCLTRSWTSANMLITNPLSSSGVTPTAVLPSMPDSGDLFGSSMIPVMAASAAATALTGSRPCRKSAAAGSKSGSRTSSDTSVTFSTARATDAATTCSGVGGSTNVNFVPVSLAMRFSLQRSRSLITEMAVPFFPARPVRPERCTKVSLFFGSSKCTTRSTSVMSRPRAATSVATSTLKIPLRKSCITFSLVDCGTSPCSGWHATRCLSQSCSSSTPSLVCAKQIVFLPCAYTVMRSIITSRLCWLLVTTARLVTLSEIFSRLLPTRSIVSGSMRWWSATSRTQSGSVALNICVCRCGGHSWRMRSTSSWNPSFSISSASSSTRYFTSLSTSRPVSSRSLTRPGVPMTTSEPFSSSPKLTHLGVPP